MPSCGVARSLFHRVICLIAGAKERFCRVPKRVQFSCFLTLNTPALSIMIRRSFCKLTSFLVLSAGIGALLALPNTGYGSYLVSDVTDQRLEHWFFISNHEELARQAELMGTTYPWPGDMDNRVRVPVKAGYISHASMSCGETSEP